MLPHAVSACPEPSVTISYAQPCTIPALSPELFALAAARADQAPRISPADAAPLIAIFRAALAPAPLAVAA